MKKPYFLASLQQIQPVGAVRHYRCHIFCLLSRCEGTQRCFSADRLWHSLIVLVWAEKPHGGFDGQRQVWVIGNRRIGTLTSRWVAPQTQNTFVHFRAVWDETIKWVTPLMAHRDRHYCTCAGTEYCFLKLSTTLRRLSQGRLFRQSCCLERVRSGPTLMWNPDWTCSEWRAGERTQQRGF